MELGLRGKVAVITASSKGLGRSAAEALAREGMRCALCSRTEADIKKTAGEIRHAFGVDTYAEACDVSVAGEVNRFAKNVLERFGTVHAVFTNAGGPPSGGIKDFGPVDFENAVRLNLMSAVNTVYAFLPAMKEQRWGRIIASTSITVKQPLPGLVLSNVSRAGVTGFIKSLSTELAPLGITANAVAPGYIMTERVENLVDARTISEGITREDALNDIIRNIPAGRIGTTEEFGALVAFLASEKAAYINGVTVLVDGGFYRGLM
jgi:3-oxoacyl-[acyl-carrier protein] reductase